MFITFEGIDGSGKSTQIGLLKKYLNEKGYEVLQIREPGGTPLSENVRDLLLDNKNALSPETELLLFEAARADLSEKVIKPALKENKIVICDRFYDSTTAYQGYGRLLELDIIKTLNAFASGSLVPDITFYLRISVEDSLERITGESYDRMESSGKEFFNRVKSGFDRLADDNKRFVTINALDSIEIISQMIINSVDEFLINNGSISNEI